MHDCNNNAWPLPEIDFGPICEINRMLRSDPESLELPTDKQGKRLTDFHHSEVQGWFLLWPGAPVAIGALLLKTEIQARKLDADGFAKVWKGDAIERLRAAIWQAWIEYLPSGPRQLAEQLARQAQAKQALSLEQLPEMAAIDMQVFRHRTERAKAEELAKLQPPASSVRKTAGDSPESSDSTPDPLPIEPSN